MSHNGESWIERSPYNPLGICVYAQENGEEKSKEVVSPSDGPSKEANERLPEAFIKPAIETSTPAPSHTPVPISHTPITADTTKPEEPQVVPSAEINEKEKEAEGGKKKMSRRRVAILSPANETENTKGDQSNNLEDMIIKGEVVLRRPAVRSRTVNYGPSGSGEDRTGALRRQSLVMLQKGHTGEKGSRKFRAALRRDSIYEGHPGWESIRRLGTVVG